MASPPTKILTYGRPNYLPKWQCFRQMEHVTAHLPQQVPSDEPLSKPGFMLKNAMVLGKNAKCWSRDYPPLSCTNKNAIPLP
ncbi:MAG: hypothetical protein D6694_01070 [Gammaproteobacteria bacterium]|nr:MAG: hypothetical protein D6694_01070 [Gammaproteobacteria bacterium]